MTRSVVLGIEAVGTAMHQRLVEEGKPGSTSRSGAPYSTWVQRQPPHRLLLPQPDRAC